ncbi:MAG: Nramp family divalent metal transporter [Cyclobacteriaceae bacterium]|nr:Nramp family divalent metal transporter [Cyclobacteriaceae bacterium]
MRQKINDYTRALGPGLITAALVLGPGTLTVTSKLGSQFELQMLWVIPVAVTFMSIFTVMSARYGFFNAVSLMETIQMKYGNSIRLIVGISIFLIAVSFQSGNAIGAGLAAAAVFETSHEPWIVFFSALAIITLFFRSFYKILEKLMIALVLVMMISFLITAIISFRDIRILLEGLIPKLPSGSELLAIALVATSCSIAGAFYQSYLVQQKSWKQGGFTMVRNESIGGIAVLGVISALVMISAANVLYANNIQVQTVADMGLAMEPLFGKASFTVFMVGLFAASFSSLLGNATLGGNILADTLAKGTKHEQWTTRFFIMAVIAAGSIIAIAFSQLRLMLIIFAQGFTILMVPIIAFILVSITGNRKLMHGNQSAVIERIMGFAGIALLSALAMAYAYFMLIP